MINLNKELLDIDKLQNGKTQNIEVKVGKKLYYVDVDKNCDSACVDFYQKVGTNRKNQSKYSVDSVLAVFVKTDALLDRAFFEEIEEIKKAQEIYRKWGDQLK